MQLNNLFLYQYTNILLPFSGSEQNGEVFRENGGTKCTITLVNYNKPRRLALRLLTQLILLKGDINIPKTHSVKELLRIRQECVSPLVFLLACERCIHTCTTINLVIHNALSLYAHYMHTCAEGSVDFSALLDLLNQSSQTAVLVKAEVFQAILRIFQLDSSQKSVFREVFGFHYLISVMASLIGSLAPRRSHPWIGGKGKQFSLVIRQLIIMGYIGSNYS